MTEAFICDAIRTPVGRYNGGLAAMRVDAEARLSHRTIRSTLGQHASDSAELLPILDSVPMEVAVVDRPIRIPDEHGPHLFVRIGRLTE